MSEEMKTEIEKRIEQGAAKYVDELTTYENFFDQHLAEKNFKAGAKFILMLPELREIREVLEWYATKGGGPYTDAGMWRRAKSALETLKKAGLV